MITNLYQSFLKFSETPYRQEPFDSVKISTPISLMILITYRPNEIKKATVFPCPSHVINLQSQEVACTSWLCYTWWLYLISGFQDFVTIIMSYLLIFIFLHTFSTMIRSDTLIAELGTITIPIVEYRKYQQRMLNIAGNGIFIYKIDISYQQMVQIPEDVSSCYCLYFIFALTFDKQV